MEKACTSICKSMLARHLPLVLCVAAAGCSAAGSAGTPPFSGLIRDTGAPSRIVIYGDNRCRHPLEFWMKDTSRARQKVAYRIAQIRPDLVVNTGDVVDRGGSASSWKVFDTENAWLRRMGVPYFPVLGNHEFLGGSQAAALGNYFARFPYLDRKRWYSFEVGGVAFLMLDTNFGGLTAKENNDQLKWILKSLDDFETVPDIKLVAVVTHHPPFTNSKNELPDIKVMHTILPLLNGHPKTKLFLSGHSHTYERFRVGNLHYVVTGGGGAPLDEVEPATFPDDLYGGGELRGFHYCLMTLYKNQCTIEMFELQHDGSWMVQDSVEIKY